MQIDMQNMPQNMMQNMQTNVQYMDIPFFICYKTCIWNPYFWYMPGIHMVYTMYIESSYIYRVYMWYIHGYKM